MYTNLLFLSIKFLFVVILTETITNIISKSGIFLPFREILDKLKEKLFILNWLNDLITCPYCFSVWAAWFCVVSLDLSIRIEFLNPYFGYFLTGLVVHRVSNVLHFIIDRIDFKVNAEDDEFFEPVEVPKIEGFNSEDKGKN